MIALEHIGARERLLINLTQRIREEFERASGVRMTVAEASRFWGLDEETCAQVLARLLAAGFLVRGADGRYWQMSSASDREFLRACS
jgi:2,4-dienoyl-CoA reductase-like NADH-dependent reductase (Old Yellow Enzyme family)